MPKTVLHRPPPLHKHIYQTLGSCTCSAMVQKINMKPIHQARGEYLTVVDAERKLYPWVTRNDPFQGEYPPDDTGSSVLTAAKGAVHFELAEGFDWYFGFDQMLAGLPFGPIEIGIDWPDSMFIVNKHGFIEFTNDRVDSGHALLVIGANVRDQYAWVLNQWRNWGVRNRKWQYTSRAKISFAHLRTALSRGGEAMRLRLT
jgi:hypothetical protein